MLLIATVQTENNLTSSCCSGVISGYFRLLGKSPYPSVHFLALLSRQQFPVLQYSPEQVCTAKRSFYVSWKVESGASKLQSKVVICYKDERRTQSKRNA